MGGGSSTPSETTTTTKSEPWEQQKPYLEYVMAEAKKQYEGAGPEYYPGQMTANLTPQQIQAQQMYQQYATGAGEAATKAGQANQFLLGDVLDPTKNVALQQYAEGAVRPVYQALTEEALPSVRGEAMGAGQYGGSRQGIAEGLAISRANQTAGDITSKIYAEAYGQGLDAMTKGLALAPSTTQMGTIPAQVTEALGTQQQAIDQQAINELITRWNYDQNLDSAKLAQLNNLVSGGLGGTTTGTIAGLGGGGGISPAMGAVGGGAMGLASAGMIAEGLGIAGGAAAVAPWSIPIMAILGAMMSQ
jgi:hypothetical protein